jgi:drug/metabolite transporter (DMT)-like permease
MFGVVHAAVRILNERREIAVTHFVLGTVLLAALMHALWNSLISRSSNKGLFTMALHVCSALLALPTLLVVGLPSSESHPHLIASVALHGLYIYLLTRVYTQSAFGPAYIVMRGVAPVFVMFISLFVLGESFDLHASMGLLFLVLGILCLMFTYQSGITQNLGWGSLKFALINASIIGAYTVVDGAGARVSGNPLSYVLLSAVFEPILVYVLAYRNQTKQLWSFAQAHAGLIVLGSVISTASYAMVLWAMTVSPIALVSALRETSVVFAMLISVFWFKEGRFAPAAFSTLLVMLGLLFLKA